MEFHNGIDIAVSEGTKILAIKDGIITQVGFSNTYGNFVKYKTDDNYEIMYAHLKKIYVKEKEKVKQKQTIALSGNTGTTTGAHLHYSIWHEGVLIDPIGYVNLPYTDDVKLEYEQRGEDIV